MAKPGSREAAVIAAGGAMDLSKLKQPKVEELSPEDLAQVLTAAEGQLGLRCAGCGSRISTGLKFTKLHAAKIDGKVVVDQQNLAACNGANGCDFGDQLWSSGAFQTAELFEYRWLDGGEQPFGVEAPKGAVVRAEEPEADASAEEAAPVPAEPEAKPDLTTAEGVDRYMRGSTSERDWNVRTDAVKAANGDDYPSFWYSVVISSGLADEVMGQGSSEIKVTTIALPE